MYDSNTSYMACIFLEVLFVDTQQKSSSRPINDPKLTKAVNNLNKQYDKLPAIKDAIARQNVFLDTQRVGVVGK